MPNRNYYVLRDDNCRFPSMTKEEIFSAIGAAVAEHGTRTLTIDVLTGLKEVNKNKVISLWVGTQAEFNAIESPAENTLYLISDHNAIKAQTMTALQHLFTRLDTLIENIETATSTLNTQQGKITAINQAIETCRNRIVAINTSLSQGSEKLDGIETDLPTLYADEQEYITERDSTTQLWSGSKTIDTSGGIEGILSNIPQGSELVVELGSPTGGNFPHTFAQITVSNQDQYVYVKDWGSNSLNVLLVRCLSGDLWFFNKTQIRDISVYRVCKMGV